MAHCSVIITNTWQNELLITFNQSALHETHLWHNPHYVFYNSDTCLTMSTLVNGWNPIILILQSAFTWLVSPKMLNPWWLLVFKNDHDRQIDKVSHGIFHVYALIYSYGPLTSIKMKANDKWTLGKRYFGACY